MSFYGNQIRNGKTKLGLFLQQVESIKCTIRIYEEETT